MTHLLGVDTGGTFTDAVIWCDDTERVLGSAKAPTTHDDLAAGIGQAIDGALADAGATAGSIALVSLSTTLATNALVEGKGRRACLVLVGFDEDALDRSGLREALGDDALIVGRGGHTSHGDEAAALDEDAILAAVEAVAEDVDAFAVTAQFSVRNPGHEMRLRDEILRRTDRPVTCSHELSAALNGPKRGVTALLNARLVALIEELLTAASSMLTSRGIDAPVMIVRGNGSLVSTSFVRGRPIETILSGPAASLLGAARLADTADAVVSDIGGTTTDVAVVTGGRPRPSPDGAVVGGHQTMVEAVEIRTHGLGGDSEVR
ncbi:MAG: hydantoinase/oxoprolinase family protein, partial [Actinomycetota bacterium]